MKNEDQKEFRAAFRLAASVKGILFAAVVLLNLLVVLLAKSDIAGSFVRNMSNYDNWGGLLFNFAVMWLSVLCPLLFFFGMKKRGWISSEVFLKKPALTEVGTAVGYSVVFVYFVQIIGITLIQLIFHLLGKSLPADDILYPSNLSMRLFLCVVVAVMPAFLEEFCVRGAVLSSLKKYGVGFASVISALVFMMLHNTIEQLPLAFAAGLSFAFCTFKFRSIWPAVAAHFTINLNSCILALILSAPEGNARMFVFLTYVFMFFSLIGALSLMGFILYGFRLPKYEKPSPEIKKKRRKYLATTPSVYIFAGMFLLVLGYNLLAVILS